jgi:hypothetical protein
VLFLVVLFTVVFVVLEALWEMLLMTLLEALPEVLSDMLLDMSLQTLTETLFASSDEPHHAITQRDYPMCQCHVYAMTYAGSRGHQGHTRLL